VNAQVEKLLYEALETEMGGVDIYTSALESAQSVDLKEEWTRYLDQTRRHVSIVLEVLEKLGLPSAKDTPGRTIVRHIGRSLVEAMEMAREAGDAAAAEIVAAECVVLAETKDHQNWELIGEAARRLSGEPKKALLEAQKQVESEEDEHLYHTQGWARELWIRSLGLPAVLPPPEEKRHVRTAIGAAFARKTRALLPKDTQGRKSPAPAPRALAVTSRGRQGKTSRTSRRTP